MAEKRAGRKKGGHNKGYFYRKARGWYVYDTGKAIPLRDEDGTQIKSEKANTDILMDAYAHWRTRREEEVAEQKRAAKRSSGHAVYDICKAYLYDVQVNGSKKTLSDRLDTLFDLCWGIPPEYRAGKTFDPKNRRTAEKHPTSAALSGRRLHWFGGFSENA